MPNRKARPSLRAVLRVEPGSKVRIEARGADDTHGWEKDDAPEKLQGDLARLAELQERLWAEHRHRILVVLQGMDASGKDGTIRHVMSGLHPLGCRVVGFGVPSAVELAHDYLWRVHQVVPGNGEVVIFNRSHYEDVLVVRVNSLVPEERWRPRYEQINAFEGTLAAEGTTILKFFLHISPDEQLERFRERYEDPTKRWKFKVGDLTEREKWHAYMEAYDDVLERCSTPEAPWYVIPADRKWFRNLAIAEILADELERLDPRFPERDDLPDDLVIR